MKKHKILTVLYVFLVFCLFLTGLSACKGVKLTPTFVVDGTNYARATIAVVLIDKFGFRLWAFCPQLIFFGNFFTSP